MTIEAAKRGCCSNDAKKKDEGCRLSNRRMRDSMSSRLNGSINYKKDRRWGKNRNRPIDSKY